MVLGIGVEEPFLAGLIIALFALATVIIPFVSVAIWRSASNYPREAWWQTPLAWSAKLCAAISGFAAALSLLGVLYLGSMFIYAAVAGI